MADSTEVAPESLAAIRQARSKFIAMAATYSLGSFNDNFFKQAASLLAIAILRPELQSLAGILFALPFILLAAPAGWLSDRFPKRRVVIAAKCLEVAAMTCGAAGICLLNWPLILVMVTIMGLHSTIFSPALNGSIPELYPASHVLRANSLMKMATTAAILLGIICAGLALSAAGEGWRGIPRGRLIVATGVMAVALGGLLLSFGVPRRPAANPAANFPWAGPADTVRVLYNLRRDPLLFRVIGLDAFIWFVAVLEGLVINVMGKIQFQLDTAQTSYLVVAELAGLALGGLICGRIAAGGRWLRVLGPAALVLTIALALVSAVPLLPEGAMAANGLAPADAAGQMAVAGLSPQIAALYVLLMVAGAAGGMLLVPLESFIQARPPAEKKGEVWAAGNFAAFIGILLAGAASYPLNAWLVPTTSFAVVALLTLPMALWVLLRWPRSET